MKATSLVRTPVFLVAVAAAWWQFAAVRFASAAEAGRRPNVVLIITDDQHREQANFLPEGRNEDGKPRNLTPNLDRLAREGVILRGFTAPARCACPAGLRSSRATSSRLVTMAESTG
jgi:arylsulfatase A-like enzyme